MQLVEFYATELPSGALPRQLTLSSWFMPGMSSKDAAEWLLLRAPGAFVIRSSSSGGYALSLRVDLNDIPGKRPVFHERIESEGRGASANLR
jgi:hypothetical protein